MGQAGGSREVLKAVHVHACAWSAGGQSARSCWMPISLCCTSHRCPRSARQHKGEHTRHHGRPAPCRPAGQGRPAAGGRLRGCPHGASQLTRVHLHDAAICQHHLQAHHAVAAQAQVAAKQAKAAALGSAGGGVQAAALSGGRIRGAGGAVSKISMPTCAQAPFLPSPASLALQRLASTCSCPLQCPLAGML